MSTSCNDGTNTRRLRSARSALNAGEAGPSNIPARPTATSTNVIAEDEAMQARTCPICQAIFKSKAGVGVHMRSKHPVEANARVDVTRKKARWSEEERKLMAKYDIQLRREGVPNIVEALLAKMPGRSYEAIKSQLQYAAYKATREEVELALYTGPDDESYDEELANESVTPPQPGPTRAIIDWLVQHKVDDNPQGIERMLNETTANLEAGLAVDNDIERILAKMVPMRTDRRGNRDPTNNNQTSRQEGRRQRRRREYARAQTLYRLAPRKLVREILDGVPDISNRPSVTEMDDFWSEIFGEPSKIVEPWTGPPVKKRRFNIYYPVTPQDITSHRLSNDTAPGPDQYTSEDWNKLSPLLRARFFNICLANMSLPKGMKLARTIFIPKKDNPASPSDFRPLSITSVATRQLHKILATRLRSSLNLNYKQRAFLPVDGVLENTATLDAILSDARTRYKEVHMATLDVKKAFDSVSHGAIDRCARRLDCQCEFAQYLRSYYEESNTILELSNSTFKTVPVNRGVKQGDPLSPILFNMVVDEVLDALSPDIGFPINGVRINGLAFADDIILIASTKGGLQALLNTTNGILEAMGMEINAEKTHVLSIIPSGKKKTYKVMDTPLFHLKGEILQQTTAADMWRYLGIPFSVVGRSRSKQMVAKWLRNVAIAPLKPEQRLNIIKKYIVPRILHGLVLGRTSLATLNTLDILIRNSVRRFLRLPKDLITAAFYAPVSEGGLGMIALKRHIPAMKIARLNRLTESTSEAARAITEAATVKSQVTWANKVLRTWCPGATTAESIKLEYTRQLHASVDGFDLTKSRHTAANTDWHYYTKGGEYIKFAQLRFNSLPTRMRTTRGARRQAQESTCRAGCRATETVAHVIQQCHRTHGGRIRRHDHTVAILREQLIKIGWTVLQEATFQTPSGEVIPDLIIAKDGCAMVVDAQIRSGDVDFAHSQKVAKYANNRVLLRMVSDHFGCTPDAQVTSATISYKGIWSVASANDIITLGCTRRMLSRICTSVMRGSWLCWTRFNQMTTMAHHS